MKCKNCGTTNSKENKFCKDCGTELGRENKHKESKHHKKSFIRKIPGFRSNTGWKKVLAIFGYGFIILFILAIPFAVWDSSKITPEYMYEKYCYNESSELYNETKCNEWQQEINTVKKSSNNDNNIITNEWKWSYYKRDGKQLTFAIKERVIPMTEQYVLDIIIVPSGTEEANFDNFLRLEVCGLTPDTVYICEETNYLRDNGFSNTDVTIFVAKDYKWNIKIPIEATKSAIKSATEARRVYELNMYIPEIDEDGFVSLDYVNKYWCEQNRKSDESCAEYVNRLRTEKPAF